MPTPGEKKALLFLSAVFLTGSAVRVASALKGNDNSTKESKAAIERQIAAVDSVRKHGKGKRARKSKPKDSVIAPAIIDLDIATADQIETLRGIGPGLAKRIVADRDSLGPFGSLEELKRVNGVGPKLAAKIDSSVTFSLLPRPHITESSRPPPSTKSGRRKPRRGESEN
jgi:competence ComEA-like helix-hairpin-helix protein